MGKITFPSATDYQTLLRRGYGYATIMLKDISFAGTSSYIVASKRMALPRSSSLDYFPYTLDLKVISFSFDYRVCQNRINMFQKDAIASNCNIYFFKISLFAFLTFLSLGVKMKVIGQKYQEICRFQLNWQNKSSLNSNLNQL